jgi:hypothetical protein
MLVALSVVGENWGVRVTLDAWEGGGKSGD